jgi:hypothetical protein
VAYGGWKDRLKSTSLKPRTQVVLSVARASFTLRVVLLCLWDFLLYIAKFGSRIHVLSFGWIEDRFVSPKSSLL